MRSGAAAAGRPGAGGGVTLARAGALVAALALACVGPPHKREPPEPPLRIWTPGLIHWSGDRRIMAVAIENSAPVPVPVEDPDPRRVRVVLFNGVGPDRICEKDAEEAGPVAQAVSLRPGEMRPVPVDLGEACARVPPGEYRYEVGYDAPAVAPGPPVRLRTAFGHVLVAAGPTSAPPQGGMGSGATPAGDDEAGAGARRRR